jgi:hypothetical protein
MDDINTGVEHVLGCAAVCCALLCCALLCCALLCCAPLSRVLMCCAVVSRTLRRNTRLALRGSSA